VRLQILKELSAPRPYQLSGAARRCCSNTENLRENSRSDLYVRSTWPTAPNATAAVANRRHTVFPELHSRGKFGAVGFGEDGGTCPPESHWISTSRINNPKGTFMKCASIVKAAAAAALVVGLAGCTDLKPIQAQIDDLKAQVAKAQNDVASAKSAADSAGSAASSAGQAASGAQSTANQALAAAHASQSCCDATNEKIDRMFKRSVSK
jgi:hypothetical protein